MNDPYWLKRNVTLIDWSSIPKDIREAMDIDVKGQYTLENLEYIIDSLEYHIYDMEENDDPDGPNTDKTIQFYKDRLNLLNAWMAEHSIPLDALIKVWW